MSTLMVDISTLGNLNPVQPLDLSVVPEAPKQAFSFPRAGVYELRAPESFPTEAFGKTQGGNLSARVDPVIVGPSNEGYEVRFTNIYATVYTDPRTGVETSGIAQYLQAFGITEQLDGTPEQAANLIASTAGKTAKAYLNWEANHRPSGFKLKGMKNFPIVDGKPVSSVEHPDESVTDQNGQRLRLRANIVVSKWLPRREGE